MSRVSSSGLTWIDLSAAAMGAAGAWMVTGFAELVFLVSLLPPCLTVWGGYERVGAKGLAAIWRAGRYQRTAVVTTTAAAVMVGVRAVRLELDLPGAIGELRSLFSRPSADAAVFAGLLLLPLALWVVSHRLARMGADPASLHREPPDTASATDPVPEIRDGRGAPRDRPAKPLHLQLDPTWGSNVRGRSSEGWERIRSGRILYRGLGLTHAEDAWPSSRVVLEHPRPLHLGLYCDVGWVSDGDRLVQPAGARELTVAMPGWTRSAVRGEPAERLLQRPGVRQALQRLTNEVTRLPNPAVVLDDGGITVLYDAAGVDETLVDAMYGVSVAFADSGLLPTTPLPSGAAISRSARLAIVVAAGLLVAGLLLALAQSLL